MLISAGQQSESVLYIYIYSSSFYILFCYGLSQDGEFNSLFFIVPYLFILCLVSWGYILGRLSGGPKVSQSWCCPAGWCGWHPAGPGLVPAYWWAEPGSKVSFCSRSWGSQFYITCVLVCRARSWVLSMGDCGLRVFECNLPTGRWCSVPAHPLAWPEVFHYWCLEADGCTYVPRLIS